MGTGTLLASSSTMRPEPVARTPDLFEAPQRNVALSEGAMLLGGFALPVDGPLLAALGTIVAEAPFRNMVTPGGFTMSVAMTNCGAAGWLTDRRGYRYDAIDPKSGRPWPAMPVVFADVAQRAATASGFDDFSPDACLINRYQPGARLTLHQDKNERDFGAPIVSVSLGLPAVFLWGGLSRPDRARRLRLVHGDVVVWGGPARLVYHGVDTLRDGTHALTGAVRYNLTFRRAL
jgi:DNA oxidative demethylase